MQRLSRASINGKLFRRGISLVCDYLDLDEPADFVCEFGHFFTASPRKVIEGKLECSGCATSPINMTCPAHMSAIEIATSPRGDKALIIVATNEHFSKAYTDDEREHMLLIQSKSFATGAEAHAYAENLRRRVRAAVEA